MFYLVIGEEPFYYELDLDNYFEDKLKPSYFRGKGRYKIWVLNIEDRKKETIKAKIKGRKLLEYFNNKQETNLFEEIENIYQQLKRYIVVMKRIEIPKEEENPEEETKKNIMSMFFLVKLKTFSLMDSLIWNVLIAFLRETVETLQLMVREKSNS